MLCSVCIATYKRPKLLEKLIDSLSKQELPESVELEVIIVDNDKLESAKEVVKRAEKKIELNLRYFAQPVKNISLTRNIAVKEAKGDYILFIDDDEIASREWVNNLYKTIIEYKADAVFGRVISYFDSNTPEWVKNCSIYNRPSPNTGSIATSTRTGNVIIKTSLLRSLDGPFAVEYGVTGGSDTQLFGILRKKGAKFVNCHEATTYEYVPPERANLKWLILRSFRTGNNFARRQIEFKKNLKFFIRLQYIFIGTTYSIISLFLSAIYFFNKTKRVNWFITFISNWGKVAAVFGYFPSEYL